jgi:hypothetical protein
MQAALDGYAKFLREKDLALPKHQPYLVRWVREFLPLAPVQGCDQRLAVRPVFFPSQTGIEPSRSGFVVSRGLAYVGNLVDEVGEVHKIQRNRERTGRNRAETGENGRELVTSADAARGSALVPSRWARGV